jgi:hypothetical protein
MVISRINTTANEDSVGIVPPSSSTVGLLTASEWLGRTPTHFQCICRLCQFGWHPPTPLCLARRSLTVGPGRGSAKELTKPSDIVVVVVEEFVFIVICGGEVRKVDFVSQQSANAPEPLDELGALL